MFRSLRAAPIIARRAMSTASAVPKTSVSGVAIAAGAGAAALLTVSAQAEWYNPLSWFSSDNAVGGEWDEVKKDLEKIFDEEPNHGPFFVRLAWHCAGSFDKTDGTGGSNGATMRFSPEADHGGNAGLGIARDLLEDVKAKHPDLTYADIYTFAGAYSIEMMGGPNIPWKAGRTDAAEGEGVTPDGRLPDAGLGAEHLRDVFYRMGFDDREIVALSGAHSMGFCHDDRSGFSGPWTEAPTTFSNLYFNYLLDKKWVLKNWEGPEQFVDAETQTLMMLPTDMARNIKPLPPPAFGF